jgi:hypothetical protein
VAVYDDVVDTATAQTGLRDFGDDSFREGLEVLVTLLRDEARLNTRGEAFIYPRIVGYLAQRLQVEGWYRRHPDIDDVPNDAPLIGLGLPRTGSTALSMLLARDPNIRYLRKLESSQPCPPPSTVQGPVFSTHDVHHDDKMFSTQALKQEMASFPALQQAGVRYRWDGEETFGMLERSNPLDKISRA